MPRELVYALRVSIDGLRPWEYDCMPADLYSEILFCQRWWPLEHKRAKADAERRDQSQQSKVRARSPRKGIR